MGIESGERLNYLRTGQMFVVKKITREFVIFHCLEDMKLQVMVSTRSVPYLFERHKEGEVRRT